MRITKVLFLNIIIIFLTNCTAWPLLVPVPPGKTSTTIYPIDLTQPATVPNLRIINEDNGNAVISSFSFPTGCPNSVNLGAIDKSGNVATPLTWGSSNTGFATVDGTGLVNCVANNGTTTITATWNTTSVFTATLTLTVGPTPSILGFDGQQFLIISGNTNSNEEK